MIRRFLNRFNLFTKRLATIVETWREGQPIYTPLNFPEIVKSGWRKNELIYSCVSIKSDTAAQVGLDVLDISTNLPVPDHPLKRLIQRPNPFMSEFDFWYSVITMLHLSGRAPFEKERDRAGRVIALWGLRPDWLKPIASKTSFIAGYQYDVPGESPRFVEAKDILEFRLFDPLNPYAPWPPVAVASRVGDVDNTSTDYIKLFFDKGATPAAILKTTQKLTDAAAQEIKQRWMDRYGGSEKWIEPAVLDRDAEYMRVGLTFDEMGFGELDARNETRICSILKVPPIIVNAKVGLDRSTYSNYSEARRAWWEDTLIPMYMSFQDTIENDLVNLEFPGVNVAWNFAKVIALREDEQLRWERANNALQLGGITVNEYRSELGLSNIGPKGDVFLRGLNVTEVFAPVPQPPSVTLSLFKTAGEAREVVMREEKALDPIDKSARQHFETILESEMQAHFADLADRVRKELAD